ncbi:hypothetical protein [Rossellomorea aquimaris]|uniref:hypothetical protein n=1 Tax=Rossellomorea aquimaris TaxID=189382 RepID=UPI0005CA433D|nr:hypothetical protein [Rossellomorea aquimaris]
MVDIIQRSVKYVVASSLILSAGAAVEVPKTFAAENAGTMVIEDGGGQGGVTWTEYYRKYSGSYSIVMYRSANGGKQWKEVTYNQYGYIIKVLYGTY